MRLRLTRLLLIPLLLFFPLSVSYGLELETKYATVVYDKEELVKHFNSEVRLGGLSYLLRNKSAITVEDETKNKIDVIVERVQSILDMFPKSLKFKIVLYRSDTEVRNIYKLLYGKNVDFISFYSPGIKTVFISVGDINLTVLAHELAHVVLDFYFVNSPPVRVHEVLAQYVEAHLFD